MSRSVSPPGGGNRVGSALLLVLGVAIGGRLAWELLAPVVPFLIMLLVIVALYVVVLRRR